MNLLEIQGKVLKYEHVVTLNQSPKISAGGGDYTKVSNFNDYIFSDEFGSRFRLASSGHQCLASLFSARYTIHGYLVCSHMIVPLLGSSLAIS